MPACFGFDESPPIHACAEWGDSAASGGELEVLPSLVPGLEVDSAGWRTDAHSVDLSTETLLILASRIRVTRDIAFDSLALVYGTKGPRIANHVAIADPDLSSPLYTSPDPDLVEDRDGTQLKADTLLRTERIYFLNDGTKPRIDVCPATVRLVPRHAMALHMFPGRFEQLAREDTTPSESNGAGVPTSLKVIWDSAVSRSFTTPMPLGVVRNHSDSSITGAVAALVLHKAKPRPGLASSAPADSVDTLEYILPTVPPRGVVGFSGGSFEYLDSIVDRPTYLGSTVRGRRVATERERYRVSKAPKQQTKP